jgi:hypothetical protein
MLWVTFVCARGPESGLRSGQTRKMRTTSQSRKVAVHEIAPMPLIHRLNRVYGTAGVLVNKPPICSLVPAQGSKGLLLDSGKGTLTELAQRYLAAHGFPVRLSGIFHREVLALSVDLVFDRHFFALHGSAHLCLAQLTLVAPGQRVAFLHEYEGGSAAAGARLYRHNPRAGDIGRTDRRGNRERRDRKCT